MWVEIKIGFTRHEMWALAWAERLPFFSVFFAATLWVWMFLPAVLISPIFIFLIEDWPVLNFVISLPIALSFLIFVAPWFFRWYFLSISLMFGGRKMARFKRAELDERLKLLTKS